MPLKSFRGLYDYYSSIKISILDSLVRKMSLRNRKKGLTEWFKGCILQLKEKELDGKKQKKKKKGKDTFKHCAPKRKFPAIVGDSYWTIKL